jgi:hypothetical protein
MNLIRTWSMFEQMNELVEISWVKAGPSAGFTLTSARPYNCRTHKKVWPLTVRNFEKKMENLVNISSYIVFLNGRNRIVSKK